MPQIFVVLALAVLHRAEAGCAETKNVDTVAKCEKCFSELDLDAAGIKKWRDDAEDLSSDDQLVHAAKICNDNALSNCCVECVEGSFLVKTSGTNMGSSVGAKCAKCADAKNCKTCTKSDAAACHGGCAKGWAPSNAKQANTCDRCASGYYMKTGATPTCNANGDAKAKGDPHVTNIRGESFDVLREGTMDVVVLPRGASAGNPVHHLTVQAKIARASRKLCEATFIEQVSAFGSWLGGENLAIDAGTIHDQTPLRLKLGRANWIDWEKVDKALNVNDVQLPKIAITSSRDAEKHPTIKVAFDNGGDGIRILVSLFQHKHFSFLNLDVDGLENYEAEVGGILGLDSHALAASPDVECKHKFERMNEGVEGVASRMMGTLASRS